MYYDNDKQALVFKRSELAALLAFASQDRDRHNIRCVQVDLTPPYRAYATDGHKLLLVDHGDIRREVIWTKPWLRLSRQSCKAAIQNSEGGPIVLRWGHSAPRFLVGGLEIPTDLHERDLTRPPAAPSCGEAPNKPVPVHAVIPNLEDLGGVGGTFGGDILAALGTLGNVYDYPKPVIVSFNKSLDGPMFAQAEGEGEGGDYEEETWTAILMPMRYKEGFLVELGPAGTFDPEAFKPKPQVTDAPRAWWGPSPTPVTPETIARKAAKTPPLPRKRAAKIQPLPTKKGRKR